MNCNNENNHENISSLDKLSEEDRNKFILTGILVQQNRAKWEQLPLYRKSILIADRVRETLWYESFVRFYDHKNYMIWKKVNAFIRSV